MVSPELVSPPVATTAAFVGIVLGLCVVFLVAVRRATSARAAGLAGVGVAVWLVLTGLAPVVLLDPGFLPGVVGFFLASNLTALGVGLSPLGRALARSTPLWALVGVQAFRLPLEVILHAWAEAGTIPPQMSWSGDNLDVISGIVALVVGIGLWRGVMGRGAAWAATGIGLALLLNVMRVALLSVPGPLRAYTEGAPLLLAFHLPFAWIVPFCVAGALLGHVLTIRQLLGATRPG